DGDCIKPDPRALAETCALLGADASQTLLIGDFIYDMIGARRAGMRGVLVREKIELGWDEWIECALPSMRDLVHELASPGMITPWEYRETAQRHGAGFLRAASGVVVRTPGCEAPMGEWLMSTAALGVWGFAPPDAVLSPKCWKKNPFFDPALMGTPLADVIRAFLRTRFPLAAVVPDGAAIPSSLKPLDLPGSADPKSIESFLLSIAARYD
ncbi:MAG: HAD hydrolase-like protein, partial [Synergistaceae bacterium]|nr:HAD hydrolase-like protein [Synergistaceae bacterium]